MMEKQEIELARTLHPEKERASAGHGSMDPELTDAFKQEVATLTRKLQDATTKIAKLEERLLRHKKGAVERVGELCDNVKYVY